MNELDEGNLDKQLREKLEPHGRQPSPAVWGKINQRINQPAAPAAPLRPWVWIIAFISGMLLLLIGNQLPNMLQSEKQISFAGNNAPVAVSNAQTTASQTAQVAAANQAKTGVSDSKNLPATGELLQTETTNPPNNSVTKQSAKTSNSQTQSTSVSPKPNQTFIQKESLVSDQFTAVKTQVKAGETETENQTNQSIAVPENAAQESVVATANEPVKETAVVAIPEVLQALVTLEQNLQPFLAQSPETAQSANQVAENLQAQIAELAKLQQRADSLLNLVNNSEYRKPHPVAAADYQFPNNARLRWSAALAFAPERSFMTLSAPAADSLMEMRKKHESGREGYNASVMVDYQLNDRVSIGAGVGVSSYGVELPVTEWETQLHVVYDTTEVINYQSGTSTNEIMTIRYDTVYQLEPVLNDIGQVISYDSIPIISSDTTIFTIIVHDSLEIINTTLTPRITKTEVATYKVLKTDYNFFTLPVNLRYRLTPGARWWADVGIGAQLQLFRGGSQVITRDGNHYETRKIGAKEGPFRPINLALMGNLALNYALSPRLSVSVAPAVRWQAMSIYKKETGLRQQPFATGLQFGIRFAL